MLDSVEVVYNAQKQILPLLVVARQRPQFVRTRLDAKNSPGLEGAKPET